MSRRTWRPVAARAVGVLVLGAGALLAPPVTPQSITADGMVESRSGGFEFPDGTIQTTAAGSGDPCPTVDPSDEMIRVGGVCIDKYEASIWDAPTGGNQITGDILCRRDGQDCDDIYARSVAGVLPRDDLTQFQAQAALANSGKRLPTNAEWQMAAAGTPDDTGEGTTPCNTRVPSGETVRPVEKTGARPGCVSDWGAFDMVGNVAEWVADWIACPEAPPCIGWGDFSDDLMCIFGSRPFEGPTSMPACALYRSTGFEESAGPLSISAWKPSVLLRGFRGAR